MRDEAPVLIAAGQFTFLGLAEKASSPPELLKIAAKRAVADTGLQGAVLARLDALAVVAFSIAARGGLWKLALARLSDPPVNRRLIDSRSIVEVCRVAVAARHSDGARNLSKPDAG